MAENIFFFPLTLVLFKWQNSLATEALLQFIVTTGYIVMFWQRQGFTGKVGIGDASLQRNSFFKTSSECSAGDLLCTSEKQLRVTAVEALRAPAIRIVYLSVERSRQCGLYNSLQMMRPALIRYHKLIAAKVIACRESLSHLLPHRARQLYRLGRNILWQQRCSER
jgi:hypothetical protein